MGETSRLPVCSLPHPSVRDLSKPHQIHMADTHSGRRGGDVSVHRFSVLQLNKSLLAASSFDTAVPCRRRAAAAALNGALFSPLADPPSAGPRPSSESAVVRSMEHGLPRAASLLQGLISAVRFLARGGGREADGDEPPALSRAVDDALSIILAMAPIGYSAHSPDLLGPGAMWGTTLPSYDCQRIVYTLAGPHFTACRAWSSEPHPFTTSVLENRRGFQRWLSRLGGDRAGIPASPWDWEGGSRCDALPSAKRPRPWLAAFAQLDARSRATTGHRPLASVSRGNAAADAQRETGDAAAPPFGLLFRASQDGDVTARCMTAAHYATVGRNDPYGLVTITLEGGGVRPPVANVRGSEGGCRSCYLAVIQRCAQVGDQFLRLKWFVNYCLPHESRAILGSIGIAVLEALRWELDAIEFAVLDRATPIQGPRGVSMTAFLSSVRELESREGSTIANLAGVVFDDHRDVKPVEVDWKARCASMSSCTVISALARRCCASPALVMLTPHQGTSERLLGAALQPWCRLLLRWCLAGDTVDDWYDEFFAVPSHGKTSSGYEVVHSPARAPCFLSLGTAIRFGKIGTAVRALGEATGDPRFLLHLRDTSFHSLSLDPVEQHATAPNSEIEWARFGIAAMADVADRVAAMAKRHAAQDACVPSAGRSPSVRRTPEPSVAERDGPRRASPSTSPAAAASAEAPPGRELTSRRLDADFEDARAMALQRILAEHAARMLLLEYQQRRNSWKAQRHALSGRRRLAIQRELMTIEQTYGAAAARQDKHLVVPLTSVRSSVELTTSPGNTAKPLPLDSIGVALATDRSADASVGSPVTIDHQLTLEVRVPKEDAFDRPRLTEDAFVSGGEESASRGLKQEAAADSALPPMDLCDAFARNTRGHLVRCGRSRPCIYHDRIDILASKRADASAHRDVQQNGFGPMTLETQNIRFCESGASDGLDALTPNELQALYGGNGGTPQPWPDGAFADRSYAVPGSRRATMGAAVLRDTDATAAVAAYLDHVASILGDSLNRAALHALLAPAVGPLARVFDIAFDLCMLQGIATHSCVSSMALEWEEAAVPESGGVDTDAYAMFMRMTRSWDAAWKAFTAAAGSGADGCCPLVDGASSRWRLLDTLSGTEPRPLSLVLRLVPGSPLPSSGPLDLLSAVSLRGDFEGAAASTIIHLLPAAFFEACYALFLALT